MPWLNTKDLDFSSLSKNENDWVYNALDSAVTAEVWENLTELLDDTTRGVYSFSRAMQAPMLDIMRRGIKVDLYERDLLLGELENDQRFLQGS